MTVSLDFVALAISHDFIVY